MREVRLMSSILYCRSLHPEILSFGIREKIGGTCGQKNFKNNTYIYIYIFRDGKRGVGSRMESMNTK